MAITADPKTWTIEDLLKHRASCPSGSCAREIDIELQYREEMSITTDEIIASLQAIAVSLSDSNPSMST